MGARFQEKPSGFTQFLPTHVCFFIPIPPMFLYLKNKSWQDRALLSLSFSWTSVAPAGRSALPHTSSQAHRQAHTFTVQAIPSAPKSSPLSPHIKPFHIQVYWTPVTIPIHFLSSNQPILFSFLAICSYQHQSQHLTTLHGPIESLEWLILFH